MFWHQLWHDRLMTFKKGSVPQGRRASSSRGGRGGMVAAGGGLGSIVLIGLFLLFGGSPGQLNEILGSQDQSQPAIEDGAGNGDPLAQCNTLDDGNTYADCVVDFTGIWFDNAWSDLFPQQAGIEYTEQGRVIFQDTTQSGCGLDSSATGPIYYLGDQAANFDVYFFNQ